MKFNNPRDLLLGFGNIATDALLIIMLFFMFPVKRGEAWTTK